ncbi:MAG: hypothetical protein ACI9W2_003670 [Gammaproteobacteria bacterium]|jgi:hypothetical protein
MTLWTVQIRGGKATIRSLLRRMGAILAAGTLLLAASGARATTNIILDGDTNSSGINTTAILNDGAQIDGTPNIPQSSFSQEFAISASGPSQNDTFTGTILLSDVPVFDLGGSLFFSFIYDSQETGGDPSASIDDIVLSVGGTEYWNFDDVTFGSIILNDATANDETFSPLGNGSDMQLLVPVSLFAGVGLTGADTLDFGWTQSLGHNGADEWVTVGAGSEAINAFLNPNPTVTAPEPGVLGLLGLGIFGIVGLRRRLTT